MDVLPISIDSIANLQVLLTGPLDVDWSAYGNVRTERSGNLILFNYTNAAQYAGRWNYFERISRGLILNVETGEVVARPFDKFWNLGEEMPADDAMLMDATEKIDGSLGILYRLDGLYYVATRGSFTSEQAIWATEKLKQYDLTGLDERLTLLFEIVYPENRVVVDYHGKEALVLIGARERRTGAELFYAELEQLAERHGFGLPMRFEFDTLAEILAAAALLDANHEGWVLRFDDGSRFKVKGDAYKLAHKLLTGISFKRVLEAVTEGRYEQMIEGMPDEFLATIKGYKAEIDETVAGISGDVHYSFERAPKDSRKKFALWIHDNCPHEQAYMFAMLDGRDITPLIYKNAFKKAEAESEF